MVTILQRLNYEVSIKEKMVYVTEGKKIKVTKYIKIKSLLNVS